MNALFVIAFNVALVVYVGWLVYLALHKDMRAARLKRYQKGTAAYNINTYLYSDRYMISLVLFTLSYSVSSAVVFYSATLSPGVKGVGALVSFGLLLASIIVGWPLYHQQKSARKKSPKNSWKLP